MDRHIARTIVRNSAGDARVIWSIFSGYHPQELRESGVWPYIYAKTSTHHDGVWVSLCTTCKENKTRSVNEVESLS